MCTTVSLAVMNHNEGGYKKRVNVTEAALFLTDEPYFHGACRIVIGKIGIPRV